MPSKDKKSKKQKVQEEEEEVNEQVEEEQAEEEPQEEQTEKKKKKKKKAATEEEPEDEQEATQEEPAAEEEEDLVIHNKKGGKKSDSSNGENKSEGQLKKVLKQLEEVSEEYISQFKSAAEKLAKEDPVVPLSAALAILTGATRVIPKSVLTDRENYTTYVLTKNDDEIRGKSFAFSIIKRMLGEEEGDAAISHITFTKDKQSLVFDLPSRHDELISSSWYDTKGLEMKALSAGDALPDLDESTAGGSGGGRGGFGGGRGGRGGGGGGGGDGCFKCGEQGHFSRECPTGGGGGGRGGFGGRGRGGGDRGRGGFGGRGGRGGFGEKRGFGGDAGGGGKKIKFDDDE